MIIPDHPMQKISRNNMLCLFFATGSSRKVTSLQDCAGAMKPKSTSLIKAALRPLLTSVLVLMFSGCTTTPLNWDFGINTGMFEISNGKLGEFDTPTGKAVLLYDDVSYSFRLTNPTRTMNVGAYRGVKIVNTFSVGNEIVAVLETTSEVCRREYRMYAFSSARDTFLGRFGDCQNSMNFRMLGKSLIASIESGPVISRMFWEYLDGTLIGPKPLYILVNRINRATAHKTKTTGKERSINERVIQKRAKAVDVKAGPRKTEVPKDDGSAKVKIDLD